MSALAPVQIAAYARGGNATRATRGGWAASNRIISAGAGRGDVESAAAPALSFPMRGQRNRKHVVAGVRCSSINAAVSAQTHCGTGADSEFFVVRRTPPRESMSDVQMLSAYVSSPDPGAAELAKHMPDTDTRGRREREFG